MTTRGSGDALRDGGVSVEWTDRKFKTHRRRRLAEVGGHIASTNFWISSPMTGILGAAGYAAWSIDRSM
jgi:hypothetical protein